ncbi:aspartate/glutamate racemase family protein [Selenomonas montiformis]|uniref:aspartate/glutamate racemase family protein n=1 Tax=Selenomonas montiformis TaxID=2652285 RepID=UPI0039F46033
MKTIGIIGGMGPMATADLMQKIILGTDAREDQDHIPMLIDNNTAIPDRTAAILGQGPSPVPELLRSADRLTRAGADFLIMGCNTAHYFLPLMMPYLKIPVISMIDAAARFCQRQGYRKIGLLASAGTCHAGVYQRALQHAGIRIIQPDERQEIAVHDMIYHGVKAGCSAYDTTAVRRVLSEMEAAGAEAFLLGCTEIPVAVSMYHLEGRFIDATEVLAEEAIEAAGARSKNHLAAIRC